MRLHMADKPKATSSLAEKELDKVEKQFDAFNDQVQTMTIDRMNAAPKQELEQQTLMSQEDIEKSKRIYLKPFKSIGSKERFNEDYRKDYNFSMEMVQFIAENKEIIGETCEFWTKPFAGMPAEFWKVPANKPVWGPRHVAERLTGCKYHRLKMENTTSGADGVGQYYGSMAVDSTIQRLDAIPVNERKSIFMGARSF